QRQLRRRVGGDSDTERISKLEAIEYERLPLISDKQGQEVDDDKSRTNVWPLDAVLKSRLSMPHSFLAILGTLPKTAASKEQFPREPVKTQRIESSLLTITWGANKIKGSPGVQGSAAN